MLVIVPDWSPRKSRQMFFVKPASAEAGALQALDDVLTSLDGFPDQSRLKVLNHEKNGTLIQAENPGGNPVMQIGTGVRKRWIKTGIERVGDVSSRFETLDSVTDCLEYDLRCERQTGDDRPGGKSAVIRTKGSASCDVIEKHPLDSIHVKNGRPRSVAGGQSPTVFAIAGKP
jgi:hypothetical protein